MRESENEFKPKFLSQEVTPRTSEALFHLRSIIDEADEEKLQQEIESYTSSENKKAFIVYEGENPIGYVEVKSKENSDQASTNLENFGHIARIGVVEASRGQGVASELPKNCRRLDS